ncbi:hypothetical protein Ciccas_014574, partial [Cichlidogyrus casuarinus]
MTASLFHGYQTKVDRKKTWPDKSALSEPEVANKFQKAVEKLAVEQSITSVEDLHKAITKAELTLPRTNIPSKAAKPWYSDPRLRKLLKERRSAERAYRKGGRARGVAERLKTARCTHIEAVKRAKEEWIKENGAEIQRCFDNGECGEAWRKIRYMAQAFEGRVVKTSQGVNPREMVLHLQQVYDSQSATMLNSDQENEMESDCEESVLPDMQELTKTV